MTFEGLIDGGVFCQDMGNLKVRFCQAETVVRFIIIDAVVVATIAVWGFFVIHRALKPEPVAKDKEKKKN